MRVTTTHKLAAAAAAGTLLLGSAAAVAATSTSASRAATTKGKVEVWVTASNTARQKILITGAIGDHGTATSMTKSGKVSANGKYVRIHLHAGTFMVNAVKFNKRADSAPFTSNKRTCSAYATVSGPVKLYDGTGAYAGITGSVHITTSFAAVFPRHRSGPKRGTCEGGENVQPVAQFDGQITGSGIVSFTG